MDICIWRFSLEQREKGGGKEVQRMGRHTKSEKLPRLKRPLAAMGTMHGTSSRAVQPKTNKPRGMNAQPAIRGTNRSSGLRVPLRWSNFLLEL